MRPLEQAWRLLKMPVVNTDVPGLQMAYMEGDPRLWTYEHGMLGGADQQVWDAEESHPRGIVGNVPSTQMGQVTQMTPNQYFDALGDEGGDANAEYRWPDKGERHIQDIVQGISEGQVMGMPSIDVSTGGQEGGHRMEALRQMGYGDTPVPVMSYKSEPMDLAMRLLKGRVYYIGDQAIPETQTTLTGQSIADRAADLEMDIPFRERMEPRASKQYTGLNYYVSIPKRELAGIRRRNYEIRRGDTDEIVGKIPMDDQYLSTLYSPFPKQTPNVAMFGESVHSGDYKPIYSQILPEHQGQNLYARALMGLLSAGDAGVQIISDERNAASEGAHRSLMDMYSRAGGNLESLTGYEPASESNAVRYNQIFNDGYGSLRTFDPGGLPVRVIDEPSKRLGSPVKQMDLAQTDLEDFGFEP